MVFNLRRGVLSQSAFLDLFSRRGQRPDRSEFALPRGVQLENSELILEDSARVKRDLVVAVHAEHLQGLSLSFLIGQIGIKILVEILGLLALAVLVAMVVLRMHVPSSRRQRAAFDA